MQRKTTITIVGSGLAGIAMAITLAKKGLYVELYDENPNPHLTPQTEGRSYNLVLYLRGIEALKKIGISEKELKKQATFVKGYTTHLANNEEITSLLNPRDGEYFYQITRQKLHSLLLEKARKYKRIRFFFNCSCIGVDRVHKLLVIHNTKTNKLLKKKYATLIGADGINSNVRKYVQENGQTTHILEIFEWGYKEIFVSPKSIKSIKLNPDMVHRWPREYAMLFGFPNADTSISLMLALPKEGKNSFHSLHSAKTITAFVKKTFPDLLPILPTIISSLISNPLGKYSSIKTSPWYYRDSIVLIGDAAHALLPFYGQGLNAALEDCIVLGSLMSKYSRNFEKAFRAFELDRKIHTDLMADLAKENFFILQHKSGSLSYIFKDKAETLLHKVFPIFFTPPLYKLVIYTTKPYVEVYNRYKKQERLLNLLGLPVIISIMTTIYLIFRYLMNAKITVHMPLIKNSILSKTYTITGKTLLSLLDFS